MDRTTLLNYRLGDVFLEPSRGLIRRRGEEIPLRAQPLHVLLYLIEHRDRLVPKDELFERIWNGTAVTDDAVVQCVVEIRKALGDDARTPRFVRTVPKLGYQLVAPVEALAPQPAATVAPPALGAALSLAPAGGVPPAAVQPIARRVHGSPTIVTAAAALVAAISLALGGLVRTADPAVAAGHPSGSDGRRVVALPPFVNQSGDRDFDWLADGLPNMLVTGLARAPQIDVLTRTQIGELGDIDRGEDAAASRTDLLAIARRAGASVVVLGSYGRLGRAIRIDVHLHAASTGQMLGAHRLTVDEPDRLLAEADVLAMRVSAALGARAEDRSHLSEVLTNDVDAYRAYSLALEKANTYDTDGALQLLAQATALDPEFAMAHARIGYIYAAVRVFEHRRALPYLERALALPNRLTEKDRLFIQAWRFEAQDDVPGAIDVWRDVVRRYPTEMEAYRRLARLLGRLDLTADAQAVLRRAVDIDADAKDLWNSLGFAYNDLGQYDKAIAAHERYVALDPLEANALDSLAITYSQGGRWADALDVLDKALALRPDFHFAVLHKGDVYFQMGRYRDAIAHYRRALELGPSDWDRAMAANHLAIAHWRRGEMAAAIAAARREVEFNNDFGSELRLAIERRDAPAVRRLRARFFGDATTPAEGRDGAGSHREQPYLRGLLALHDNRVDDALKHFSEALRIPKRLWGVNSVETCLAEAYVSLGRWPEAAAEYERIVAIEPRGAMAVFRLAQVHERLGRTAESRAGYERFLELWPDADDDLIEVRTSRARLAARPD